MDKQKVHTHTKEYYYTKRNDTLIQAAMQLTLGNIILVKEATKNHILYDSVYVNYPEYANLYRQKVD